MYPSRIIVGCDEASRGKAEVFSGLLAEGAKKKDIDILYMGFTEAEAVKLFANTYLALEMCRNNEEDGCIILFYYNDLLAWEYEHLCT